MSVLGPGDPAPRRGGLPFLVRFLLMHAVVGFGIATVAVAALIHFDPGGVATLLLKAEGHPLPLLLLWFFLGLTFGSVQMGAAFMLRTGRSDDDEPRGGHGQRLPAAAPVLVRSR